MNKTISKSLLLLEQIVFSGGKAATVKDLSQLTGWPPSTVSRLLGGLVDANLLRKTDRRHFVPGIGLLRLAGMAQQSYPALKKTRVFLEDLRTETGLSVGLGILDYANVVYLYHDGPGIGTGLIYPAPASTPGTVLLSALTDQELVKRCPPEQFPMTHGGYTCTYNEFAKRITQARQKGYFSLGNSLAVPVTHGTNVVAALVLYTGDETSVSLEHLQDLEKTAKRLAEATESRDWWWHIA
ncbi:MAG TPA: helix-turn-helix domain-containing protein [Firmicutes bacterium]|nr:helix-turn-helix domain-containing protein [Bacillota bacterium]